MPFQSQVNVQPAPGVEGDFCSTSPRFSVAAGQGAFTAGTGGCVVGRFAWADSNFLVVTNAGSNAPTGFVGREQQALITTYLAENGMTIPKGFGVTLYSGGEFWVKNAGSGAVTIGQKAFASNTTGQIQFAAAGATVSGYTETKWFARSAGAAGELIKMSSNALG